MGKYLALDMGVESGRLMAVEIGDEIRTTELHRFQTPVTTDSLGRRCWDFPEIMNSILVALSKASATGEYLSIAVDTWGLDFGLLDQGEKLIGLPVSHRDHRTDGYLEKAFQKVGRTKLHTETGSQLLEINSIYQLFAITEQTPDELAKAAHLLLMPDLVLHALTGAIGTEYTIATTTGLYDVFNQRWSKVLADGLNIPLNILGEVQPAGSIRGTLSDEIVAQTGMNKLVAIATASHDTASAVVATPFNSPGSAFISSGTWSLLGVEMGNSITNDLTLEHRLTNEGGYNGTNRLLRNVMGLWLIQEVRRDFESRGEKFSYAELVELARAESDPWRTLIYVDAPLFMHAGEMIARIQRFARQTNQDVPETPGQLAQTVFASLALQYAQTCDVLEECSGLPMPGIHIVGGGSQNDHLSQLTANVSGREVIAGPIEATAMGNAIVQAIAMGEIANLEAGRDLIRKSDLKLHSFAPQQVLKLSELRERYQKISRMELR